MPFSAPASNLPADGADQEYFAFECNRAGHSLRARVKFHRQLDFGLGARYETVTIDDPEHDRHLLVLALAWEDLGIDPGNPPAALRLGLYRGLRADADGQDFVWTSWVDTDDDVVDFHREQSFGWLELASSC